MAAFSPSRRRRPPSLSDDENAVDQSINCRENNDGYVHGSIVRIKLTNFLTYDSVEFRPGSKLNVIIGPNGTGKSSVVCGIGLGLGGKPSQIGRAGQVNEYIKHGCNRAHIEIELCNKNGPNYIVGREIKSDGSSLWTLNNATKTNKAINELMSQLKIQVGNLCQFLPQDRVADFVKMSQQELLDNTQKAIGAEEMCQQHEELKKLQNELKTLSSKYESNSARLGKEIQSNSRLEEDIKNYAEREKFLKKIDLLKKKKHWVEYEDSRQKYNRLKQKDKQLTQELNEMQRDIAPAQKRVQETKREVTHYEDRIKTQLNLTQDCAKKLRDLLKIVERQAENMTELSDELKTKKEEEKRRQFRLNDLKKQLDAHKNELDDLQDDENVEPEIAKIMEERKIVNQNSIRTESELDSAKTEKTNIQQQISRLKNELELLKDVNRRRLEIVKQKDRHTYEAIMWLRDNAGQFRKKIYEPIFTLMNLKNQKMAMYLEKQIPYNDMFAFVCEDRHDMNKFLEIVRDQKGLRISAVEAPRTSPHEYVPQADISCFRNYGFHSYMREVFTAPEAVLSYLCKMHSVHDVPLGNERTKQMVAQVISQTKFNRFYTDKHCYSIKISKYSKNKSTMSTELYPARLLTVPMNVERITELESELQRLENELPGKEETINQLKEQARDFAKKLEELKKYNKELIAKRDHRKTLLAKIEGKEIRIAQCEAEVCDLEKEEEKTEQKVKGLVFAKLATLNSVCVKQKELLDEKVSKLKLSVPLAFACKKLLQVEAEYKQVAQQYEEKKRVLERFREELHEVKACAKHLLEVARKATDLAPSESLSEDMKKDFNAFPETIEDINSMIYESQARADLLPTDDSVINDYNNRKKEIEMLSKSTEEQSIKLDNLRRKMEEVKQQWLPEVEKLIENINRNFSRFFASLGCAGEISLKKAGNNEEEFDKYAISIRVKYRDNEELRELSPYQQSGGERSVATILYMMALQELTKVPFRCVDEINQGMDATNERKVFELMVRTSSQENTAQYFLLTPKLLNGLDFSSHMDVATIYNSPCTISHTEWKVDSFIERRKTAGLQ